MDKGLNFKIRTLTDFSQLFHGNLTCQNDTGQTILLPKMEGFNVCRRCLCRQVDVKSWCVGWTDFNQGWVRYDNSIESHVTQFTEPLTSTFFISFMGNHVWSNVHINTTSVSIFDTFSKLIHGEVSGTATQTIGLSTNENSICAVIYSDFQFFQSPSRYQNLWAFFSCSHNFSNLQDCRF